MKITRTYLKISPALLGLLLIVACSRQSTQSPSTQSESSTPASTDKGAGRKDDAIAEEILKSPEIMEARDWLTRYPKSLFSSHALNEDDSNGTPLSSVVARLSDAGAQRIVVHYGTMGNGQVFVGLVVVLPSDAAARQKVFALDSGLSQLAEQRRAVDSGQKYLYYSE